MLIEELIRLGRPLLSGEMPVQELLRLITDVEDSRVKNFYRNVFIVVLPESGDPIALPRKQFGNPVKRKKKDDFDVDKAMALGVPVGLPPSGNSLQVQGRFGVPVYLTRHKHYFGSPKDKRKSVREGFIKNKEAIEYYLQRRLEKTSGLMVTETALGPIVDALHDAISHSQLSGDEKNLLGLVVLASCTKGGLYRLDAKKPDDGRIGETPDGRAIVPNYARILTGIWEAKVAEGREVGTRLGACTIAGTGHEVVSAYCKAWPWATLTWNCPLPDGGDKTKLVEGIGLSPESYRALVLGACTFNKLTKRFNRIVVPQMFAPVDTRPGGEQVQRRKSFQSIYGSAFVLPVRDEALTDEHQRFEFVKGIRRMIASDPEGSTESERAIATAIGVEQIIPDEFADDYRMTLVYFSKGKTSDADIHLRAIIQDVVPSRLRLLCQDAVDEARTSMRLARILTPRMTDDYRERLGRCYLSVPYLLARAYGGAYLWTQLEAVLHGRTLYPHRFTHNAARRLESLVPNWPKSRFTICDEVAFYLNFRRFLGRVNPEVTGRSEDQTMRPWKELIRAFEREPVESMNFESISELGFACGMLIRCFGRWYSGSQGKDKDFLKHRVLTFGADLSPRQVWVRGVKEIPEAAAKHDDLRRAVAAGQLAYYPKEERRKHSGDFSRRLGVVLTELETQALELEKQRDSFMTGFWAGYCLQGYDRPPTARTPKTTTPTQR